MCRASAARARQSPTPRSRRLKEQTLDQSTHRTIRTLAGEMVGDRPVPTRARPLGLGADFIGWIVFKAHLDATSRKFAKPVKKPPDVLGKGLRSKTSAAHCPSQNHVLRWSMEAGFETAENVFCGRCRSCRGRGRAEVDIFSPRREVRNTTARRPVAVSRRSVGHVVNFVPRLRFLLFAPGPLREFDPRFDCFGSLMSSNDS